jgi:hypothetical protein
MGKHGLDYFDSRQGQVAGSCECGNEPLGSTNAGNFVTSLGAVGISGRTVLHGVI